MSDLTPRTRMDENGHNYTAMSDRDDLPGLIWDSEMLNWTLYQMAERLGLTDDAEEASQSLEVVPEELVEQFFGKFDHYEELLCTCDEELHPVDTTNTGDNNNIIKQEK